MKIGELARAAGLPVETVRFYEKQGLLPAPARQDNNYRRYDARALQRLRFIGNCRALDMSLDEVRTLLDFIDQPRADCSAVDALVDEHLRHVRSRIAELRALEKQLKLLQSACGHQRPHEVCGIVLALSNEQAASPPRRGVHSSR
ncbi:MAG: Cd(II)/Pb(II)-responsive transcriptional regulator [Pseudomonadota bacterium]